MINPQHELKDDFAANDDFSNENLYALYGIYFDNFRRSAECAKSNPKSYIITKGQFPVATSIFDIPTITSHIDYDKALNIWIDPIKSLHNDPTDWINIYQFSKNLIAIADQGDEAVATPPHPPEKIATNQDALSDKSTREAIDTPDAKVRKNIMERDLGKLLAESEHAKEKMAELAQTIREVQSGIHEAIQNIRTELQQDRIASRNELHNDLSKITESLQRDRIAFNDSLQRDRISLHDELRQDLESFKSEIKSETTALNSEMQSMKSQNTANNRDTMWKTTALVATIVGAIVGVTAAVFIYVSSDMKDDIKEIRKSNSELKSYFPINIQKESSQQKNLPAQPTP